jgi:hypothetical protein
VEAKTIKEWFDTAEQPYKEQLLANTNVEVLQLVEVSLEQAIKGAFFWEKSPEKHDYWADYVNSIRVPLGTN